MVLRVAVNGTYLGVAFEPVDLCPSQQVFHGAEAVEEHCDKLNDKIDTENNGKHHSNSVYLQVFPCLKMYKTGIRGPAG